MELKIEKLRNAAVAALEDINRLLSQLRQDPSEQSGSISDLRSIAAEKNATMMAAYDKERIIGMGTLYCVQRVGKRNGYVEDVVVDSKYRGHGLGEKIMNAIITEAKKKKIHTLSLTSRPAREAANKLYQKLGFERKDTNVYRLKL